MEVLQDSYKDTKIGRIPKDWEVIKMGDVASLKNGANFSTKDVGEGRLMVNVKDLYDFKPFVKIVDETRISNIADSYILKEGDLLFVRSSLVRDGVGYSAMYKDIGEPTVYSGFIIRSRINSPKIHNPFVAYYLRSGLGRKNTIRLSGTVTITNIGQDALALLPIPVPPLPEQQKIAEILSTVDEQISTTERIIEKSKELKKGLMQKLFSEGIGHTEFKDTKIGRIPKDWEVVRVGDICKLQGGYAFKSKDAQESGVRWLKIANVGFNRVKWEDESFLPLGFERNHSEYVLNEGDIVVAMTRPVLNGKLKICKIESKDSGALLNQRVGRVRLMDNQDADYFFQCFNTKRFVDAVEGELFGTDPPNISSKMFENIRIPLPLKEERKKISEILYAIDNNIKCEEKFKSELEQLKKGLMQQLLTGQKRVKV